MKNVEIKTYSKPDEVRKFENGDIELLNFGEHVIGRFVLQPGWKWSKSVKPIVETNLCEAHHFTYVVSGILRWRLEDGTEFDLKPGEVAHIKSPHDAWVVGDEPFVAIDWAGATHYAEK